MLSIIYGVIFAIIIYYSVKMFYSVNYTPGVGTLYNSPIVQKLFPMENNKMFPSWGYNEVGMYKGDPTKYGQGSFYPKSGKGYVPNKYGSGGPDPSGGMRKGGDGSGIPSEVDVGWWNGPIDVPERSISGIYDNNADIPEKMIADIGWWGDTF
jgi:hypothetical protein